MREVGEVVVTQVSAFHKQYRHHHHFSCFRFGCYYDDGDDNAAAADDDDADKAVASCSTYRNVRPVRLWKTCSGREDSSFVLKTLYLISCRIISRNGNTWASFRETTSAS